MPTGTLGAFLAMMAKREHETINDMRRRAYDDSSAAFGDQTHSYSQRDAMRHGLIAGQMAQRYGEWPARLVGYGFEAYSPHNWTRPDAGDILMDLHNDDVGAAVGARTPSYEGLRQTMQEMAGKARQRDMKGFGEYFNQPNSEMVYLHNTGKRAR